MPAGRLTELTGLTTGAVTGVIDRLEEAGYVRRTDDPNDRRRTIVEPIKNKKLERKIEGIFRPLHERMHKLLSSYTDWISRLMQQQNSQIRRVKNQKNYGVCEDNHLKYMYCLSASYNPSSIITPQPLRFSYFETNSLSLSICCFHPSVIP